MNRLRHRLCSILLPAFGLISTSALAQSFYDTGVALDKKAKTEGTITIVIVVIIIAAVTFFIIQKNKKK